MWHMLEKIGEQVTKYSTFLGQLWYMLVFVFRLIVIVAIGGSVYGDEQSAFKCSTDVVGCQNICYNEFAKISHLRFWAFQLLAVATPTVLFHFYSLYVIGEIEKLKIAEDKLKAMEEGDELVPGDANTEKDFRKMSKRRKSIGHVKHRQIYSGSELKNVTYTNKIYYAYYVSIIARLVAESVFIYLGYKLFMNMDPNCAFHPDDPLCPQSNNPFYFLWMKVPAFYRCSGIAGSDVHTACAMHVGTDGEGYVPCFVSRPYEKTVFLCYMNVLSGICFLIAALDLIIVTLRHFWKHRKPSQKHLFRQPSNRNRNESVFFHPNAPSAPSKNYYDDQHWGHNYPSLGVPVRIANRYQDPGHNPIDKKVVINDEERHSNNDMEKENYSDDN